MAEGRPHPAEPSVGAVEVQVFEVPLTGPGEEISRDGGAESPPTDWRRVLAIALVGGTLLGVGGAILLTSGGDDSAAPSTTLTADETGLTTLPMLPPLDTLPAPLVLDEPARPDVSVPAYPEAPDLELADLVDADFDIASAVARLGEDVARRSETHVELGVRGYVLDVTIERDPVRDRYRIVAETRGITQVAIVDIPTGTTYINPGTDNRIEVLNAEFITGSTAADVNEYFDRLLLGPLRPDTYDAAATEPRRLVTIDGVGSAQEYATAIPGGEIPEWQIYAFGPVFEFDPGDRPGQLTYSVYVSEDGHVAEVDGVAVIGTIPQLVRHRITLLDEAPTIDLPEPGAAPATGTPASTTPGTVP